MSLKLAEKQSGIENALILLNRLPDHTTIEDTAVALFKKWQIGKTRSKKGVLFLHSKAENLFKIEVSYELEPVFTDILCHRLEEAARTYMLSEIPQDFLSELLITMNIQGHDSKNSLPGNSFSSVPAWTQSFLSGGAGVKSQGYRNTVEDFQKAIRLLPASHLKAFEPASDAKETLVRYLKSMEQGIGDPSLPLLTEGSQIYRALVPRNDAQQIRAMAYYENAMPYQLSVGPQFALAVFQPGTANLPIVLRRSKQDLWYIDEPKAWTYFHRFEDSVDFFPKYRNFVLASALGQTRHPNGNKPIFGNRVTVPLPEPYPFSLTQRVRELTEAINQNPTSDKQYAELGDLYLFEMNWISKAIYYFEKASAIAPDTLEYHWRLYDLYLNHSEVEKSLEQLRILAKGLPRDAEVRRWYKFHQQAYSFGPGEFFAK